MTPRRAIETTNEETHTLAKHTLAPDELGSTVCVGEILVEIVGTTIGDGFWKVQPLVGPYPSGAENDRGSQKAIRGGRTVRGLHSRHRSRSAT